MFVGFALQGMGKAGEPVLIGIQNIQKVVFRIMMMIMWAAPIGAFGAIAAVVGATGWAAIGSMAVLMGAFYLTCILFIVIILGSMLRVVTGLNIFALMKYLAREYLLIFSTSSSESALPRLIAKMEHAGVSKPVVGITVPTGYSFDLDGTAIYLTMSALFGFHRHGHADEPGPADRPAGLHDHRIQGRRRRDWCRPCRIRQPRLQAHRPELLGGMGVIVGIDKFMSEARALTNFTGNAVATLLIGKSTKEIDMDQAKAVLAGQIPFDENSVEGH